MPFCGSAPSFRAMKGKRDKRCEEILAIQSMGLKKRLEHTRCKCAVVGISGGLDSTLALLVTVQAFGPAEASERADICSYHAGLWNH